MGLFDFGNTLSSSNQDSPVGLLGGRLQKWTDPIAWLPGGLGDKWVDLTSHDIPKWTNQALAPVAQFNGKIDKAINPLRKIPAVNNVMDTVEAKPADAIGTAVGGYFAAPALTGLMSGSGSLGGAASGGAAGTGPAFGAGLSGGAGMGAGTGSTGLGGSMGALGSGTFDTTAAYASPLSEGLGTGTAGTGMGSSGLETGTLGNFSTVSRWQQAAQAMLKAQMNGKGLFGNQDQQQPQQVQLGAANSAQPMQVGITSGPVLPSVRNQMMAQALMRGY